MSNNSLGMSEEPLYLQRNNKDCATDVSDRKERANSRRIPQERASGKIPAQGNGCGGQFSGATEAGGRPAAIDQMGREHNQGALFGASDWAGCEGLANRVESRTSAIEKSGNLREPSGLLLGFPKGKGKSGNAGLSLPFPPGKSGPTSLSPHWEPRAMKSGDLMDMRNALLLQVEQANAAIAKAEAEQEPYREAFNAAHNDLLDLHERRRRGGFVGKTMMLAGYDKRMWAGFRWQPFKAALRDAEAWRSGLIKEIGEINKELDRR